MNKLRGESEIKFGDTTLRLVPEYEVMPAIEALTGKGIIEVAGEVTGYKAHEDTIVGVLFACAKNGFKIDNPEKTFPYDLKSFKAMCREYGLIRANIKCVSLVTVMVVAQTVEDLEKESEGGAEKKGDTVTSANPST